MGWFKKEEKQIVEEEIPELPELPDPNEFSLTELPTPNEFSLPNPLTSKRVPLPESPNLNFNMESKDMLQLPPLPELKNKTPVHPTVVKQEIIRPRQEMQRSQFGVIETRPRQEPHFIREPPQEIIETSPRPTPSVKNVEPIYVRLDKFEASLQSIEEIKRKIAEVENTLKKTKEIKQKEEQELEAWEKEVHIIKSRIDTIDKDIFNKFD
jgi:hypothetical protein